MLRVKVDVPELVGTFEGEDSEYKYKVPYLNKIILMHKKDREILLSQYGEDKLPVI